MGATLSSHKQLLTTVISDFRLLYSRHHYDSLRNDRHRLESHIQRINKESLESERILLQQKEKLIYELNLGLDKSKRAMKVLEEVDEERRNKKKKIGDQGGEGGEMAEWKNSEEVISRIKEVLDFEKRENKKE